MTQQNFSGTNVTKKQLANAIVNCSTTKARVIVSITETKQIQKICEFNVADMLIRNNREVSAHVLNYLGNFTDPLLTTAVECVVKQSSGG